MVVHRPSCIAASPDSLPPAVRGKNRGSIHALHGSSVTTDTLAQLLFAAGVAQFGVLVASAIVPFRLNWRTELSSLSRLHRQMYWVYGGYVVLSIVAFALLSILNVRELAGRSGLARGVCFYIA